MSEAKGLGINHARTWGTLGGLHGYFAGHWMAVQMCACGEGRSEPSRGGSELGD